MEQLTKEQERTIRRIILDVLGPTIPVPVRMSFSSNEQHDYIDVWWPKYQLSWVGRVETHQQRAETIIEAAFDRNIVSRFVGRLVRPFINRQVAFDPSTLLPKTQVKYPEKRVRLKVDRDPDGSIDEEYMFNLAQMWAEELRRTVLEERGGR